MPIRIYLDHSDLVRLHDKKIDSTTAQKLLSMLNNKEAELVYSFEHLQEIQNRSIQSAAISLAEFIDQLPHIWIKNPDAILNLELDDSLKAFCSQNQQPKLGVFVESYLDTYHNPSLPIYQKYKHSPLEEVMTDLLKSHSLRFEQRDRHTELLEGWVANQREIIGRISKLGQATRQQFSNILIRRFTKNNFKYAKDLGSSDKRVQFAEFLFKNPSWCPSFRLSFEVQHAFLREMSQQPKASDLPDWGHIYAVPYVDYFTGDKRTVELIKKAQQSMARFSNPPNYTNKVFRSLEDLIKHMP